MKSSILRRASVALLALALCASFALPTAAFSWFGKESTPSVPDFSKSGLMGEVIAFSLGDFAVKNGGKATLSGITLDTLPDPAAGVLTLNSELLLPGVRLEASALDGLRFQPMPNAGAESVQFTCYPVFSTGAQGEKTTVTIRFMAQHNEAPIARNLELNTYKNVAVTGYFDAMDSEGDPLTFQLVSTPARGGVILTAEGSSQFVYTPYENKTGKDSFTYVAVDAVGNVSSPATVSVRIEKPSTRVTYADMEGSPAHKAAVRLAEEGLLIGRYCSGQYFFDPAQPVTRGEFLALAMAAVGLEPLTDVSVTGFSDDGAIPTWAKGYVSSALKAGAIRGSLNQEGLPVFDAASVVTQAEAAVMLDRLLGITAVAAETGGHWASQASANLAATGVVRPDQAEPMALATQLTRADVAELLDGALDVLSARKSSGWFGL